MRSPWSSIPVIVLTTAVLLAACGSSAKPTAASVDPALVLAQCMRVHGAPSFPDPRPGGGIDITPGSGLDPQSPAFRAAEQACKRYAPTQRGPLTMSPNQRRRALGFAECMRKNGEPDFSDPTLSPPSGAASVLALRGMVFALGPGVDPKAPAFKAAATRCGIRLPQ